MDGTLDKHGQELAPPAELRAPLGVYGVIGNRDYPSGYRDWLRFFRSCGIRMLVNEHAPPGDGLTNVVIEVHPYNIVEKELIFPEYACYTNIDVLYDAIDFGCDDIS